MVHAAFGHSYAFWIVGVFINDDMEKKTIKKILSATWFKVFLLAGIIESISYIAFFVRDLQPAMMLLIAIIAV